MKNQSKNQSPKISFNEKINEENAINSTSKNHEVRTLKKSTKSWKYYAVLVCVCVAMMWEIECSDGGRKEGDRPSGWKEQSKIKLDPIIKAIEEKKSPHFIQELISKVEGYNDFKDRKGIHIREYAIGNRNLRRCIDNALKARMSARQEFYRARMEKLRAPLYLKQAELNREYFKKAALHAAQRAVKWEKVRQAKRDLVGQKGLRPAVIAGDYDQVVSCLAVEGVDPNVPDSKGVTLLMRACYLPRLDIIEALLNANANVHMVDYYGQNALMLASYLGHDAVVELLLSHGADLNSGDRNRNNALILASMKGHDAVVELLLSHGAKLDHKNVFGITALNYAREGHHFGIARKLEEAIKKRDEKA